MTIKCAVCGAELAVELHTFTVLRHHDDGSHTASVVARESGGSGS